PPHPPSPLFPYTTLFRSSVSLGERRRPKAGLPLREESLSFGRDGVVADPILLSVHFEYHLIRRKSMRAARQHVVVDVRDGLLCRSEEHTSELQSRSDLVC